MSSQDPFPMSSPEAKALEDSVEGGGNELSQWDSMNTASEGRGPAEANRGGRDSTASQSLVFRKKKAKMKKRGATDDDIYADLDIDDSNQGGGDDDEEGEDEFLDVPLTTLRSPWRRPLHTLSRFSYKVYVRLYGDQLPPSEMLRTLCLAMTLFFMIGGYWLLRSLKDPILSALCGVTVIPKAKMLSVFVVLGVVSIYNRMLDSDIPRHQFFYIFGSFYCALFGLIAILLMHPTIGLANEKRDPRRILGWISYCAIESFGSVMVSLFWSFANSNFSLETAKASYGVMVATAQVGSILGPTVVSQYAASMGVAKCYMVGALCMVLLQGTIYMYVSIYGVQNSSSKKKAKAGVLEGLELFWEHNYVKGIFAISCLFMVEVTIVDFTMKRLANDYFAELHPCQPGMSCWDSSAEANHSLSNDATAGFTTFMGLFGQATNTLSFFLSFLGTSAIIRFLGLRWTLLLFPSLCLAVIIFVRLNPTLYVVFSAMMMLKAASYSLNNPTKEILYQPTSPAVKYKAKSWIDIFGARGSKALGSVVTNAFADSAQSLVANGSLVGMAVASFLIWNANFMGKEFDKYMASGHIVGAEPGDHDGESVAQTDEDVQMTGIQNAEDTSCAIYEDDNALDPEDVGQGEESGEQGVEESKVGSDRDANGTDGDNGNASSQDSKGPEVAMV